MAIIVIANAVYASFAFIAHPLVIGRASEAKLTASLANCFAVFAMLTASLAYHNTTISETAVITKSFIAKTVSTVFTAVLTDLFGRTFATDVSASVAYVFTSLAATAASVFTFTATVVYAFFAVLANISTV